MIEFKKRRKSDDSEEETRLKAGGKDSTGGRNKVREREKQLLSGVKIPHPGRVRGGELIIVQSGGKEKSLHQVGKTTASLRKNLTRNRKMKLKVLQTRRNHGTQRFLSKTKLRDPRKRDECPLGRPSEERRETRFERRGEILLAFKQRWTKKVTITQVFPQKI